MTTRIDALTEVRTNIQKMEPQFRAALPAHIPVEKFMRVVLTAIQTTPTLLSLDRTSLFAAATKAAQDGLLPDGREGAIVPFKNQAQWMPMIAGILKKVRNSGEITTINSQIVYERDDFEYWIDETGEHLKHRPLLDGDRGKRRSAYAVARTKDGGVYVEVMTEEQIQAVRSVSRAGAMSPWNGPFESEMIRKTVIRRLAKRLPMSTDLETTVQRDDSMYDFQPPAQSSPEKSPSRLAKVIQESEPQEVIDEPSGLDLSEEKQEKATP